MKFIDNITCTVKSDMESTITKDSRISIAASYVYNTFTLNLSEFNVVEDLRTSDSNVESIIEDISHKLDRGVKIK